MFQPLFGGGFRHEQVGVVTGSSRGTVITANVTPGNDGAYTQLIASTSFDYDSIMIQTGVHDSAAGLGLLDIAIGAGGAEKVIVADLPFSSLTTRYTTGSLWLPLHVPKGSRMSARVHRSSAASKTIRVALLGCQGTSHGLPPFHRCTTYGTVLGSSRGSAIDPGAVANTLGTRVVLDAATAFRIRCLIVYCGGRSATGGSNTTDNGALLTLDVGAAAAEVAIIPNGLTFAMDGSDDLWHPHSHGPFLVDIPSGSRLSTQAQSDFTTVNARELNISLLGLD